MSDSKLFSSLKLTPELVQVTQDLGYTHMTPIQEESIPLLLEGLDFIGQSKTGSGKTAAFTLPILQKISEAKLDLQRNVRIHAIVLCPTRELCDQVTREMRKLGRRQIGLQVLSLSGGQPVGPQTRALEQGVHIVVGTPGRILDHLKRRTLDLTTVSTIVLDEADRMLEMGFDEEVRAIFESLPAKRQTVFFSATFPKKIEALSKNYQYEAIKVTIENTDAPTDIRQAYMEIKGEFKEADALFEDKLKALIWALGHYEPTSSIVFSNFKATVADLARALKSHGIDAEGLHGDLEQPERDSIMAKFRNGSIRILIATDVAARGIDIHDLAFVANFELPKQAETYVHRIGRTGRAGKSGVALTLALPQELNRFPSFEALTQKMIEKLEPEEALESFTTRELSSELRQTAAVETLFISGGRKNKVRPGDILGALTGEAGGLAGTDIGKIEIHDFFSYVAIHKTVSRIALKRLQEGRIKGTRFRVEIAK